MMIYTPFYLVSTKLNKREFFILTKLLVYEGVLHLNANDGKINIKNVRFLY